MNLDVPRFTEPALCAEIGGDAWFPEKGESGAEAKRICRRCPAIKQCLAYALEHDMPGVWGGTSEQQRRNMAKRIHRGPAPINHGTESGWAQHKRRGEKACDSCQQANRLARKIRSERAA